MRAAAGPFLFKAPAPPSSSCRTVQASKTRVSWSTPRSRACADYPTLDATDAVDTLAGQPALGADVNFVHFDLTNTCWVRAVPAAEGAILVLAQCTDEELHDQGSALKEIMSSLTVDE